MRVCAASTSRLRPADNPMSYSPACPVAETLPVDVENKLKLIPDVNNAKVEITFDPPWEKDMMSEEAKLELGMW